MKSQIFIIFTPKKMHYQPYKNAPEAFQMELSSLDLKLICILGISVPKRKKTNKVQKGRGKGKQGKYIAGISKAFDIRNNPNKSLKKMRIHNL